MRVALAGRIEPETGITGGQIQSRHHAVFRIQGDLQRGRHRAGSIGPDIDVVGAGLKVDINSAIVVIGRQLQRVKIVRRRVGTRGCAGEGKIERRENRSARHRGGKSRAGVRWRIIGREGQSPADYVLARRARIIRPYAATHHRKVAIGIREAILKQVRGLEGG